MLRNIRGSKQTRQVKGWHQALFHYANDAIFLLDAEGKQILDANPAAEKLSGYSHATLLASKPCTVLFDICEWSYACQDQGGIATAGPTNFTHTPLQEKESLIRRKDGRTIPISISVSHIPCNGQTCLLIIARDISKRWQMIHQLVQTEKLAAVGRLVHSIAHEVNNPLQALHNSMNLLSNPSQTSEKRQRLVHLAQSEVDRLTTIVRRVLESYRSSREGMRPTDLHGLLRTVLKVVERTLRNRHVRVICDWHPRLPLVLAIGGHLKQVYLNLILNAVESMPHGGILTIRTYVVNESETPTADPPHALLTVAGHWQRGLSVVIEFSDTGTGIMPDDLPKVFEPFYTTRIENTGLGLAISYSIVEQHHGELSVSSSVGEGTTFRMCLPAVT